MILSVRIYESFKILSEYNIFRFTYRRLVLYRFQFLKVTTLCRPSHLLKGYNPREDENVKREVHVLFIKKSLGDVKLICEQF
jgi:hypothetical protein